MFTDLLFGPVKLLAWTAQHIRQVAEAEIHDEQAIRSALVRLNEDYDRGLVNGEQFLEAEDQLMERLEAARARGTP